MGAKLNISAANDQSEAGTNETFHCIVLTEWVNPVGGAARNLLRTRDSVAPRIFSTLFGSPALR